MRVLVTGANGFIGHSLTEYLENKSYIVYGCGRKVSKWQNNRYFACDLTRELPNIEVDVIVHTAALGPSANTRFQDYFDNNVQATLNILEYAKQQKIKRIIFLGAVSSYGTVDKVLKEDSPHNEPGAYGLTKYVAERLVKDSGIPYHIMILPGVVGRNCNNNWLINTTLTLCRHEKLLYYNGGGLFNNIVEVQDLCAFLEKRIEDDESISETYLLGNTEIMTVDEVIWYLKKRLSSKSYLEKQDIPMNAFYLDVGKAVSAGFRSKPMKKILDIVCEEVIKNKLGKG